jgi:integrase
VTLPVTDEIRRMIERCNTEDGRPFVRQLWKDPRIKPDTSDVNVALALSAATRRLRRRLGIDHFHQHDLRRTTAVAMYKETYDIRDVQQLLGHGNLQSTVWYLAGAMNPVKRSTLEIIKRPAWRKERTA